MPDICFYFQVHQPYRLRHYTFFDIGENPFYENDDANRSIMLKVAQKCYLPMNKLLLKLIRKYDGRFKVSFSISGTALDQFELYAPKVLKSFQELVATGCVELLAETYNHSLSFLYSPAEFERQVKAHTERIEKLFGVRPQVFRNTELIYNNDLAHAVELMGYKAVVAEGADKVLGWRSPNYFYAPPGADIKLMLKNYRLSDDIAFRFSNRDWADYPLTADKYARWLHALNGSADVINLFMDYETFGEHQWSSTGIFEFMEALPEEVFKNNDYSFSTLSEALAKHPVRGTLNVPDYVSWADMERDLTAWIGNDLQNDAMQSMQRLEQEVLSSGCKDMYRTWGRLQTSDHFYYMCTKWFSDGDVHKYFNPYSNPYDAYINYMNVLGDFRLRLDEKLREKAEKPKKTKKAAAKKPAPKKIAAKSKESVSEAVL